MNKHGKRLSPQTWERVRTDYEVKRMSFNELQQRYEVHRSNISRKAQKQGWSRAQVQHALDERLQAKESLETAIHKLRLLAAYTVSKPKFATEKRQALVSELGLRQEASQLIEAACLSGLEASKNLLDSAEGFNESLSSYEYLELLMKALETHSKALLRYSQAIFGNKGLPN